ncbi:MAG: glycosyltransferase family 39 protein [Chloroflexi bacterium]|nr:glycosyltransferase family 39 protein [Chloroflexota bacterium]
MSAKFAKFNKTNATLVLSLFLAAALRLMHLAATPLSWDEGWSIGLSTLGLSEINRITALDVHPPLYYDLLKTWMVFGKSEFMVRFLSVAAGLLAVPLVYVVGLRWANERVGLLAALSAAASPFLIYYSQVARMYALCTALVLLATYSLLRAAKEEHLTYYVVFTLSATAALYTFYYALFPLICVIAYALWQYRPRWRRIFASCLALGILYAPWVFYALPPMLNRIGTRTGFEFAVADLVRFAADGFFGLVFAYGAGWWPVYLVLILFAAGLTVTLIERRNAKPIAMPLAAIVLTLASVSVGAKAHMFAARYAIVASPFLALALAWAWDALGRRSELAMAVGILLWIISITPSISGYVYQKSYETSGAFDPASDQRYLSRITTPDDIVFFNVLSLAGAYERYRQADDPAWSYLLRWDPVVEPLEPAIQNRLLPATREHQRLWFVLYKGGFGPNGPLLDWLTFNLYPAVGQWREDTFYQLYLVPQGSPRKVELNAQFEKNIILDSAEFPTQAYGGLTVRLIWHAIQIPIGDVKVFVHLYDADGHLVAQHDAFPANDLRPPSTWQVGETIVDNHGLVLPPIASGKFSLVVGLYEPRSGDRLHLPDGSDHLLLGEVEISPE